MEYKGCTDNAGAWPMGTGHIVPCQRPVEHAEDNFYTLVADGISVGTRRYCNRAEAIAQAEKLCADKPGMRVYLMKPETSCTVEKSPARWRHP